MNNSIPNLLAQLNRYRTTHGASLEYACRVYGIDVDRLRAAAARLGLEVMG